MRTRLYLDREERIGYGPRVVASRFTPKAFDNLVWDKRAASQACGYVLYYAANNLWEISNEEVSPRFCSRVRIRIRTIRFTRPTPGTQALGATGAERHD